jgi:uncharacterized protein (TIRG00374 family)
MMIGSTFPGGSIRKHTWKWVVGLVLALAVMGWIGLEARRQGFQWSRFVDTLSGLHWPWLLLAGVFAVSTYAGRAVRWAVLMRPVSPHAKFSNLFTATIIGFTAITLLGRPGEFVRPYLIAVKEKVPVSSQLAAWLLERIFDLLIALLVFGFALGQVRSSGATAGPALTWVLAFGGRLVGLIAFISLLVLLLIRHFSEKMRVRLLDGLGFLPAAKFARVERLVNAFVQGVESTRSHSALFLLTLYTILEWALILACYVCITNAFGSALHFGWTDILIFMGFVAFGAIVQIPGIGGGVQVISILVLTELFHVPLELATSVALLIWLITFVVVVPAGLLLALREGLDWRKLKTVEREAQL